MVRFSLAAKYPSTKKLELTWKCGVCELASLYGHKIKWFFTNQALQTHRYFESLSLLSTCCTYTFIFQNHETHLAAIIWVSRYFLPKFLT